MWFSFRVHFKHNRIIDTIPSHLLRILCGEYDLIMQWDLARMWKFVRRTSQQQNAERQRLQKELFCFCKTVQHGFSNKPTALAWDPKIRVAAIGTATGAIKVFGKPGVEFYGHHSSSEQTVLRLLFIPSEGKLISLCDGNSLHLWEINDTAIEEIKSIVMEGRVKQISSLYIEESRKHLLVGTEGGNIYAVELDTFTLSENIIYQDVAMQNVPEGKKINPGAVEAIAEQPGNPENLLIGYRRGLMVLWNKKDSVVTQTYVNNQQLESFSWDTIGKKFLSSHNDGSYVVWSTESSEPVEEPITVYGPFPCKAITKIQWCRSTEDKNDDLIVFSGGMPRASYSDRNTVTIQQGTNKHVVLDFTSKVIDFFVTYNGDNDGCEALIILLEEELVAIDLTTSEWKVIPLPYLISLHASAVTFLAYVENVKENVMRSLKESGSKEIEETHSKMEWPINGGHLKDCYQKEKIPDDVIISGHEDGSVRFWHAGSTVMSLICSFKTNAVFSSEDDAFEDVVENHTEDEEEEWPPFRKVGCFDPYSDDPRLCIKKITFCGNEGVLTIGGAAGQVLVCLPEQLVDANKGCSVTTVNLIPEKGSVDEITYQWKGSKRLPLKGKALDEESRVKFSNTQGFVPQDLVQMMPPAAITSVALHSTWRLVAIGTAHGLALYDFKAHSTVIYKCTLNSSDFSTLNEPPISRTKSFKKSLRESFRRIRKGRSSMRQQDKRGSKGSSPASPLSPADRKRGGDTPSSSSPVIVNPLEARPIERAVEARPVDDAMGSMVRCLYLFKTNVVNSHQTCPSLWAGTNNGTVYIFTVSIPGGERAKEKVHAQLGKEIQLRHRAPVIGISILNLGNKLLHVQESGDRHAPHYALISSEEQIKIFSLPHLKAIGKLKLTAIEGARIRRVMLAQFSAHNHAETCLMALTNLGECIVLSLPDLRRQTTAAVIKREDINGISSFTFTAYGEGVYLISSSEIQRITLSTSRKTLPMCTLTRSKKKKKKEEENGDQVAKTPDRQERITFNMISNGIPEEDEDEVEAERANESEITNDSSVLSKKDSTEDVKKPITDDENQITFNHDVSAITLDSIKDHLATS